MSDKRDIKSMTPAGVQAAFGDLGLPKFRAGQVFKWLHDGAASFEEMTNLPKDLRRQLDERFYITSLFPARKQVSKLDGTVKFLWELWDGNLIESVLMSYRHGNTLCISSQVGCRMGCAFCASTVSGLVRGLMPSEMLDQVLYAEKETGVKVSNIVLMGTGEPLDNYDNVLRFLHLVNDPEGRGIGMRHISLSTCGLTEKIDALAEEDLQLTLSVSLHAPDDETRSRIMPVNRAAGVHKLVAACRRYFEKTGRRVSFEYAMISGVNDGVEQANALAALLRGMAAHVNLIPLNDVEESALKPSSRAQIKAFAQALEGQGVTVTVRRSLGGDIDAACGQLRRRYGEAVGGNNEGRRVD